MESRRVEKMALVTGIRRPESGDGPAEQGRDLLRQFRALFSPDSPLRWHRWLVGPKYNGGAYRRPDRPPTKREMKPGARAQASATSSDGQQECGTILPSQNG